MPRIRQEMKLVEHLRASADGSKRIGRLVFSTHETTEVVDELAAEIAALEAAPA